MPKRSSKPKRYKDVNQNAFAIVKQVTESEARAALLSEVMAEMGKKGGKIGGKRRMETMTPEQRSSIALKAAKARWSKPKRKRLS